MLNVHPYPLLRANDSIFIGFALDFIQKQAYDFCLNNSAWYKTAFLRRWEFFQTFTLCAIMLNPWKEVSQS